MTVGLRISLSVLEAEWVLNACKRREEKQCLLVRAILTPINTITIVSFKQRNMLAYLPGV